MSQIKTSILRLLFNSIWTCICSSSNFKTLPAFTFIRVPGTTVSHSVKSTRFHSMIKPGFVIKSKVLGRYLIHSLGYDLGFCSTCIFRSRAAKFRSMLGTYGLWVERVLDRATSAVTQGFGFCGLIWIRKGWRWPALIGACNFFLQLKPSFFVKQVFKSAWH